MVKIGVISNPLSQRNARGGAATNAVIASRPDILHRRLEKFDDLKASVAELLNADVDVLVVDGGDGTVQATLTEMFRLNREQQLPVLAVLSSGMTNLIAADAGLTGSPARGLKRLIARADKDDLFRSVVRRHVMRLEFGDGKKPVYGMFLGAAGIHRAIHLCREKVHSLGIESSAAVGVTILGLIVRWLLPGRESSTAFRGDQITVTLNGDQKLAHPYFMLIVSTLDRLALGIRPFWGWRRGGLKFTGVVFPPEKLARSIFPLLYGGKDRKLPEGTYLSQCVDTLRLEMSSPFTLDGELYQPEAGRPVEISSAGLVRFIKL